MRTIFIFFGWAIFLTNYGSWFLYGIGCLGYLLLFLLLLFLFPWIEGSPSFGHRILRISYVLPVKSLTLTWTEKERGKSLLSFGIILTTFPSVVDFESADDAAGAVRKLDGTEFKGKRVRLSEDPVRPPLRL